MTRISRIQTNGRLDYPVTVRTCHHDDVVERYREDGSPIRKIRAIRGLDAIPASLSTEGVAASAWPGGCEPRGPKPKKISGILSLGLICFHARRRSRE